MGGEYVWFKSEVGATMCQTPREQSFSTWAILSADVFVANDAAKDIRFRDSRVTADLNLGFYAGAPLVTPDGFAIGTICVIDRVPRAAFASEESRNLTDLAGLVIDQLELRRNDPATEGARGGLPRFIR